MTLFSNAVIIEDNKMDSYVLDWHIKKNGVAENILVFSTGIEALEYFKSLSENPTQLSSCIVFLDINMPKMNGFEFLDLFLSLPTLSSSDILVIMVTSSDHAEDRSQAENYPIVKGYIIKPVLTDVFKEVMDRLR